MGSSLPQPMPGGGERNPSTPSRLESPIPQPKSRLPNSFILVAPYQKMRFHGCGAYSSSEV